jgi:hypothetical protein
MSQCLPLFTIIVFYTLLSLFCFITLLYHISWFSSFSSCSVNMSLCPPPPHQLILTDLVLFWQREMVNVTQRPGCPANQDMNVMSNWNVWQNVRKVFYILPVSNLKELYERSIKLFLCLGLKNLNFNHCLSFRGIIHHSQVYHVVHFLYSIHRGKSSLCKCTLLWSNLCKQR